MIRIAQLSCGTEYSGVQKEIEKAAETFGAQMVMPDVNLDDIDEAYEKFGLSCASSSSVGSLFNSRVICL